MGQQWDQGKNQKIPSIKWKWGYNNPKSVGYWESTPIREVHSTTGLSQKKKKKLKQTNLTLHLKELEKEQQTKPQVSRRK